MNTERPQPAVAAGSLVVTVVIVIVMGIWGFNSATAPIKDDGFSASSTTGDDTEVCGAGELQVIVKFLKSSQVTVSIYNAGERQGRAGATLTLLEQRGFRAGAIGNAPAGTEVEFAEIYAKPSDSTKAQLVQLAMGKAAKLIIESDNRFGGPGVNIVIGDKFKRLKDGAPRRIKLPQPITTCE